MLVAEGAAEIALDPRPRIWDLAPLPVIIEEAGGRFSDFTGARTLRLGARSPATGWSTMRLWPWCASPSPLGWPPPSGALPGADFRRRLYWRYTLVWIKP